MCVLVCCTYPVSDVADTFVLIYDAVIYTI